MCEVDEPLGNALTGLVVTDHHEPHAREHLGRADRRDVRGGVGLRVLALPHVSEVQDRASRLGPGDTVRGESRVHLELANRALGEGAEDAVDHPAREAEHAERLLQHAHVCAVEVRHAQVEHAIAQREARIDKRRPGLIADEPVLGKTVLSLEAANRLRGRAQEHPVNAGRPQLIAEGEQATLDIFDGGPAI